MLKSQFSWRKMRMIFLTYSHAPLMYKKYFPRKMYYLPNSFSSFLRKNVRDEDGNHKMDFIS